MDNHTKHTADPKRARNEDLPAPALVDDGENDHQEPCCPPVPESRKRKAVLPSAATAIVTPSLPAKCRRLDAVSPSPKPVPAASSTPSYKDLYGDAPSATPSFKDLYGDDEDQKCGLHSITVPSLHSLPNRHPHPYRRRNSVTKFSLQASASKQMSVLEAARMTLEKLRRESLQSLQKTTRGAKTA